MSFVPSALRLEPIFLLPPHYPHPINFANPIDFSPHLHCVQSYQADALIANYATSTKSY